MSSQLSIIKAAAKRVDETSKAYFEADPDTRPVDVIVEFGESLDALRHAASYPPPVSQTLASKEELNEIARALQDLWSVVKPEPRPSPFDAVWREYAAEIRRVVLKNTPPAPHADGYRPGDKVRVKDTGETGMIIRCPLVVQADEEDGTQGPMGGTVWVGEFEPSELERIDPSPSPREVGTP